MKNIIIFGFSGFIGRDLTKALLKENKFNLTLVCSNTKKASDYFSSLGYKDLNIINFDIFDSDELKKYLSSQDLIINLIGKLFESKQGDFEKYHSYFPSLLRFLSADKKIIHISALGINKSSTTSLYAKSKLRGESYIQQFSKYIIIRPSIVFGLEDNFFNQFASMAKFSPVMPLIFGGSTQIAPIYVKDINNFIVEQIKKDNFSNTIYSAKGNEIITFKDAYDIALKDIYKSRIYINLPEGFLKVYAKIANSVGIYTITPDQLQILKYDNIFDEGFENILPDNKLTRLSDYYNNKEKFC